MACRQLLQLDKALQKQREEEAFANVDIEQRKKLLGQRLKGFASVRGAARGGDGGGGGGGDGGGGGGGGGGES